MNEKYKYLIWEHDKTGPTRRNDMGRMNQRFCSHISRLPSLLKTEHNYRSELYPSKSFMSMPSESDDE